jgi:hypothetical protein
MVETSLKLWEVVARRGYTYRPTAMVAGLKRLKNKKVNKIK